MKKRFLKSFLIGLFISVSQISIAQSDGCAGVPNLTVNTTCSTSAVSLPGSFSNGGLVLASCTGNNRDDGWFSFTATTTTTNIDLSNTNRNVTLSVWSSCGGGTELACDAQSAGTTNSVSLSTVVGVTYYIQIHRNGGNNNASLTGDICVYEGTPSVCTADMNINTTTYSNSGLTTCGFGDDFSSADACGSSYMGGDDIVIAYTPTITGCVSVSLTNTGNWTGVFFTDGCPDNPSTTCISSATSSSGNPSIPSVDIVAGTTYYITVSTFPSPQCTAFDLDIATVACPVPLGNDDCSGAYPVTVGSFGGGCVSTTSGTIATATPSSQSTTACSGTENDDVWFSFVAPASGVVNIDLLNVAGSTTDLYHSVWSGACPALSLVTGSCSDPNSSSLSGLTPGLTYYLRVYSWSSSSGATSTFDVCIEDGACPSLPANDECSGAISITPTAQGATCTPTSGTINCATGSSQSTTACFGTENDDVWFSFVATQSTHNIDITNVVGSTTDLYHSVWTGACPALTLVAGTCSDPNSSNLSGLIVGQTYYIRVYSYSSTAGATSTFDICVNSPSPPPPCNTLLPPPNDACTSATTINTFDGYCGTTSSSYTIDANAAFCGSLDNNSWLQFTASQTTVNITWWITGGASCPSGVQFEAYSGTCGSLTAIAGSCVNPTGTIGSSGTFSFSGLTIGNTYYIMIDGYAGDVCDYAWQAQSGILPIDLSNFDVEEYELSNHLTWVTKSEENNDYFIIERSVDGLNFEQIEKIDGAGNSSAEIDYEYDDFNFNEYITYYKLWQVDYNGNKSLIGVKSITRDFNDITIYPNPASKELNFKFESHKNRSVYTVEFVDVVGKSFKERLTIENTNLIQSKGFKDLNSGLYLVRVLDENGHVLKTTKIVKE